MKQEDLITVDIVFGTIELQQRPTIHRGAFGYESRTVHRDRDGFVVKVGPWLPPLVLVTFPEPEPKPRSCWAFWR